MFCPLSAEKKYVKIDEKPDFFKVRVSVLVKAFKEKRQMEKNEAEKIIAQYVKPIFGFALKRCKNVQDAEDLSQEIAWKAYRALLARDDIADCERFIRTVAHNALANYYRGKSGVSGVSFDEAENLPFPPSGEIEARLLAEESAARLRKEIAYLSKMQRAVVVAYYYENKKQNDIAEEFHISPSLVKWHLFEARKNLKRGMETMKNAQTQQFSPVEFSRMSFCGSAGTMGGTPAFFRSVLTQNIAYCAYREAKTINEIAEALGVSPVYVESEAEFLEEYGYLVKRGGKYLANLLIEETDGEWEKILRLREEMYGAAAKIFANDLYDGLLQSGLLKSDGIECAFKEDENYLLWALVPFIAANCENGRAEEKIFFEEAATIRPDGACDIASVSVKSEGEKRIRYNASFSKWRGPSWTSCNGHMLWCCRSEWTDEKQKWEYFEYVSSKNLKLLCRVQNGEPLSADEYASLAQQGLIGMEKEPVLQIVWLKTEEIKEKLLGLGREINLKRGRELQKLKTRYVKALLDSTPKHLRKMQAYELQFLFRADGWFLLYCIEELLQSGKLRPPKEEQRKPLMTVAAVLR